MKPLFYLFKTNRKWPTNFKAYKKITFPVILPAMSEFLENLKVNKLAKKITSNRSKTKTFVLIFNVKIFISV